ncbi:M23 family metallopeptidase [Mesorhizobium sp. CAU 1741]|uniref:M23 family metallopeptidase n=1 Tax=Mesorhizobium sp. CAU 1741 TaxID=3140366 RepID=UPI00325A6387
MIVSLVIAVTVFVAMPLAFSVRVWRLDEPNRAAWLLLTADSAVFVALILLVGRWDIAGIYTPFVLAMVFVLAVVVSLFRHAGRPWRPSQGSSFLRRHWATCATLATFTLALAYAVAGLIPVGPAQELAFPLRDGRFMVAQGGGNWLVNHHSGHPAQTYAADITAIGPTGFRAPSLLPDVLERYAIFGASIVSPCAGEVVEAVDGLPDLVPPAADPENAAGNHVTIACGDLLVELAHLRQGSVAVNAAEPISTGDPIGEVGNSGNTTEPHLHIHAVDPVSGEGVRMSFDGGVPFRNRVYAR